MGLLSGTVSITRFNAVVPPEGPDFERARFWAIDPGSEVRERMGFVPFEIDAPYEVAQGRYVFRVRIDKIRPDPTAVKERLRELVKTEMETSGRPFVGSKTRKKLKELAETELCMGQMPRTRIIEGCLNGNLLYVASTAKSYLGIVLALLRQAGVECDFKAPWLDEAPEIDEMSDVVIPKEPGQSVLGCRFVRALLEESDVMVEPETGSVRLATREAKVSLTGAVMNELFRYVEEGAEILSAKLHVGSFLMRFDALSYRVNGLKLEPVKNEHWTMDLDQRLEQIGAVFEMLDGKYVALKEKMASVGTERAALPGEAAVTAEVAEGGPAETAGPPF
ncbi:MAG TPA: hypothetical protein VHU81_06710 [Thermoanaerobaculia bacterium]|jgi:hypothetical protein|nr:hypothetical protein [Thermoanaerobaculia bacterium]